jgi:type III pantothenate kinase
MKTLLALDRGNDALKAAIFRDGAITERFRFRDADAREAVDLIMRLSPDAVAASCVVPPWRDAVESALGEGGPAVLWAGYDSPLPFRVDLEEPRAVGPDRLAAAAGAVARGASSAVVVDAGTAVTVDILDAGCFIGGSIMPGLGLMLEALHSGTAALPSLDPSSAVGEAARGFPGRSTRSAIAAGTVEGYIGGVAALVDRSLARAAGAVLFLTGGGASLLAGRLRPDHVPAPDLVLEGLYRILTGRSVSA